MHPAAPRPHARPQALEFFAGIGLAKMGLERAGFEVAWANDFEAKKRDMYAAQYGESHPFKLGDIRDVTANELPKNARLAWASSPCTDLSLAGNREGFAGKSSGTFWEFIRLIKGLDDQKPSVLVLENVVGLATSHGGDDLTAAVRAFNEMGYSVDVLVIDARRWVPQSRPRLFIIGALFPPSDTDEEPHELRPVWLEWIFQDESLRTHRARVPAPPEPMTEGLDTVVEAMNDSDERWWDDARTAKFLSSLSAIQKSRLELLRTMPGHTYRTAYRRTRNGKPVWEIRADAISGCLRTARGGSSKQAMVKVGGNGYRPVQVRWMTPREYASLMGAENYHLGETITNQALFGFGDAVVVPVVEWLARHYLYPIATSDALQIESMTEHSELRPFNKVEPHSVRSVE